MKTKELIDANEALRMIKNSKTDNPFNFTAYKNIWNMAHDCAISCVEACTITGGVHITRREYAELLEYKHMYEDLCK